MDTMKKRSFFLFFVFVMGMTFSYACYSQSTIEEQQRHMYMSSVNENHRYLEQLSGNWKQNYEYNRSENLEYGTGNSKNKMIFEGKFLEMDSYMDYFGTITNTKMFIGYDNLTGEYNLFTINDIGTDTKYASGTYDPDKRQWVFQNDKASMPPQRLPYKIIITVERDNKYTYEMLLKEDGEFKRIMYIHNIRQD